jgi:hypothetical protein
LKAGHYNGITPLPSRKFLTQLFIKPELLEQVDSHVDKMTIEELKAMIEFFMPPQSQLLSRTPRHF